MSGRPASVQQDGAGEGGDEHEPGRPVTVGAVTGPVGVGEPDALVEHRSAAGVQMSVAAVRVA